MNSKKRVATVSERLKEAMREKCMRQVDIVNETGLDKGAVNNYVSGKYEPKQLAINKLASVLNVSEMWLWGYDVPKERSMMQKNNDAIADIVVKLRTDDVFLKVVDALRTDEEFLSALHNLDQDKLKSVSEMLKAFAK